MADIIPPGYAEVTIPFQHSLLARQAIITFGVQLNDVGNTTMANNILEVFRTTWQATIDSNVTVGPANLRVGQDGGEALVVPGNTSFEGTSVRSDSITGNCAVLVHKRTARGGRRGRGRMYIPWCLAESDTSEVGRLGGDAISAVQDRSDDLLTDLLTVVEVDAMVVLHSDGLSTPGLPNVVTALVVDPIIGVQRRRLGR